MARDDSLARQALEIHYELKLHLLNNLDAFARQLNMSAKQAEEFEQYVKGPVRICASHAMNIYENLSSPGDHHAPHRQ